MKRKLLISLLASFCLSTSAVAAPKSASNNSIFCDLFGIGCGVVAQGAGDGKEPPKTDG